MWQTGPPTLQHTKWLTQTMFEADANQTQNRYDARINPSPLRRAQEIGQCREGQISGASPHAQDAKRDGHHERSHREVAPCLPEHHEHARGLHGESGQLRLCDCVDDEIMD